MVSCAQQTMSTLIEKYGFAREQALLDWYNRWPMKSWFEAIPFKQLLQEDPTIKKATMDAATLDSCFELEVHLSQ